MLTDYLKQLNELNENYSLKESFEIHSQLNNKIFNLDDNLMKQEIRQRLIEIADLLVSSMQENNIPIKVYDYWLVGSNAAYNYNKDSDIDIHIIVDMNIVQEPYLLRLLYDYIKSSFSQKYDITVKGHEVELYLEDIKTSAVTNGIYSLKQDKWLKFPQEQEPRIIDIEETPLFAQWLDRYQSLEDEECEQFLDDLYVMRKISLANEGEFGDGNLIFKEFRNRGYIQDLKDRKYQAESDRLTLEKLEESLLIESTSPTPGWVVVMGLYDYIDPEYEYHPKNLEDIDFYYKKNGDKVEKQVKKLWCLHHEGKHNDNHPSKIKLVRTDDHDKKQTDGYPTVAEVLDVYIKKIIEEISKT